MSQPFLEEQLRRIREMTERISEAHNKVYGFEKPADADRPTQDAAHDEDRPTHRRDPAEPRRR